MHKIFLTEDSDIDYFYDLIDAYAAADQTPSLVVSEYLPLAPERLDSSIDIISFRAGWDAMHEMDDFVALQFRYHVNRLQALRLAGEKRACPVAISSPHVIFEVVRDSDIPITVQVVNPGVIQTHAGRVCAVERNAGWLNVQDNNFDLRIREDAIVSAWMVNQPTVKGLVTSLELYSRDGVLIAQIYGQPEPGIVDDVGWRNILSAMQQPCVTINN